VCSTLPKTPPEADPRSWLAKAAGDIEVAQRIVDLEHLAWAAGFHLQQAAEKALKAVLVAHGRFPPKVHDLKTLLDEVIRVEPDLDGWDERLVPLDAYAIAERYPTADLRRHDPRPHVDTVCQLLAAVQSIVTK
jgi:HEPN domain-containing protein